MRKVLIVICSLLMIFCVSYKVNADIIWEGPYHQFQYGITANGGWFMDTRGYYNFDHAKETISSPTGDFSAQARGSMTELDGKVVLDAMAQGPDGGVNPTDGTYVKGYTQAVFSDFTDYTVFNGEQNVTTFVARRLHVDQIGTYFLNGYLSGPINFNSIGTSENDSFYALYNVQGSVSMEEFAAINGGYITSLGRWDIDLDESTRSGSVQVTLRPSAYIQGEEREVFYQLVTVLNIDAKFQNYRIGYTNTGKFEGTFQLGNDVEPLEVGGSLSPVPLPGSVLMLISGLGGLIMVARRRHM